METSTLADWLSLLEAEDFIESAIENSDQQVELYSAFFKRDKEELDFFSRLGTSPYSLKQMSADFFRHVPAFLSFDVPAARATSLRADHPSATHQPLSMDAIDRQSYQICARVHQLRAKKEKDCLPTERDVHRYVHGQFARHLLPIHWLPEFCATHLGYSSPEEMRPLVADAVAGLLADSLHTIRQAIEGKRLFLYLNVAQEDYNRPEGVHHRRMDVFVGVLDDTEHKPPRHYLLKSVVLPKNDDDDNVISPGSSHLSCEQLMLAVLLESLNLLWPDSSWRTEAKPVDLLLTDIDLAAAAAGTGCCLSFSLPFIGQRLLAQLCRLSPLTFAGTVHLCQLEHLLRAVGRELNVWLKRDACRTYHFIGSFIGCIAHSEPPSFGRFFLRRCIDFFTAVKSSWSYQELVLHLRANFTLIQQTLCAFRTSFPSHNLWSTVAELSDVHFFEEFNTVAIVAHLSLLIHKYTGDQSLACFQREALLTEIMALLKTLTKNSAQVRRWAASSAAVGTFLLVANNYEALLESRTPLYDHLKATVLGGAISRQNSYPLTCELMRQFEVKSPAEDIFTVIYALHEAAQSAKVKRKRAQIEGNVRYRDYYYGDSSEGVELMSNHQQKKPVAAIEYRP